MGRGAGEAAASRQPGGSAAAQVLLMHHVPCGRGLNWLDVRASIVLPALHSARAGL